MLGRFSDPQTEAWIDQIAAMTLFAALFYDNPLATDPLTVEVLGSGYVRPPYTVNRVSFAVINNANLLVWRNLAPATHIAWVGVFDDDTGAVMRAAAPLATAVDLASGGTYSLGVGQFALGLDVATGP